MAEFNITALYTYDEVKAHAEAEQGYSVLQSRCVHCNHYPFYYPGEEARDPGHIYSPAGVREFGISGMCEYCFDQVTGGVQDDVQALVSQFKEPEAPLGPLAEGSYRDHMAITNTNDAVDHGGWEDH